MCNDCLVEKITQKILYVFLDKPSLLMLLYFNLQFLYRDYA